MPTTGPEARFRRRFDKELASMRLLTRIEPHERVREADLAALPETARRFFRFVGAVGRPRNWSFRVGFEGTFRMAPDKPWVPCSGHQYDSSLGIARVFHMRLQMGILPTMVRDTYVLGRARMLGKVFDLVRVVDETGPDLDRSELATYLNDALVFAPAMLLGPMTTWSPVDDHAFDVSLTDFGKTVTGRVFVDERGAMRDFSTEDRWVHDPFTEGHPFVRGCWSTPIEGWTVLEGRPFPIGGRAVWHLLGGVFEYARFRFDPASLAYDVAPGA
jgi:hypothetical protein